MTPLIAVLAAYLAGLLWALLQVRRGLRPSLWSGPALMALSAVVIAALTGLAFQSRTTGALFVLLASAVFAPLFALGLGRFVVAGLVRLRPSGPILKAPALAAVALPFAGAAMIHASLRLAEADRLAGLRAFQATTVQATMGGHAVFLPASPMVGVEYDCLPEASDVIRRCRTHFSKAAGFRGLPEGAKAPVLHAIRVEAVPGACRDGLQAADLCPPEQDRGQWCATRTDDLAADWCAGLPDRNVEFLHKEEMPASAYDRDDWKPVDTRALIPRVAGEDLVLECNTRLWNGPFCRLLFMAAPGVRVRVWFERPPMSVLPTEAADARQKALRLWQVMTEGG